MDALFNAKNRKELEEMAKQNEYMDEAYQELDRLSADEEKRLEYETRLKYRRDKHAQIHYATRIGRERQRIRLMHYINTARVGAAGGSKTSSGR